MARTRPTGRGPETVEIRPTRPPDRGHRIYECRTCLAVLYDPPHNKQTAFYQGAAHR